VNSKDQPVVPLDGEIGETYRDSTPSWPEEQSSIGRPNVVVVVLDDLGFGSLGCYGSEISTPSIDRLAGEGYQCTNFHATALCSPTRASLLTGRNSHAVGMAFLSHVDDGYPGYRGRIGHDSATVAEMLVQQGYNTLAVGKWHLAPMDQTTAAGPYDQWPLGRGFERYYGFLEGLTDQYHPELFYDNHPVAPPREPEDGYHLTEDLVDKSIEFIRDQTSVAPEKPFFLYLALGATHSPFQAPEEFVARYRGAYAEGWDVIRERRYEKQLETGVIPGGTQLPPRNSDVPAWNTLTKEAKLAYAKYQEVFAGFLEHSDAEIGRLFDYLRALGRFDDTVVIVVSDNGASQEGGPHGILNTTHFENGHFPTLDEVVRHKDEIDGRRTQVNYPLGWAQAANTPLKRYKQNTHAGGVRTPMILKLPDSRGAEDIRSPRIHQAFQHVTDIVPTILDLVEVSVPAVYRGVEQLPVDGVSMLGSIADPSVLPEPRTQYFETLGHRAIWSNGWKAVAFHQRGSAFETDVWELYHVDEDFSERYDLASTMPEKLGDMIALWYVEAERNKVLPLDDRGFAERTNTRFRPHSPRDRMRFVYLNGMQHLPTGGAAPTAGRSFEISATLSRDTVDRNGVVIAHGSWNSGYCLMVSESHLVYDYNYYGDHHVLRSSRPVPLGQSHVALRFLLDNESTAGAVEMLIDGDSVGEMHLAETFEFLVAFQGLDVGADRLSPVREFGEGEFAYGDGLTEVTVELLDGEGKRPHAVMD